MEYSFLSRWTAILFAIFPYVLCFLYFLLCKISRSRYERRREFSIKDGSGWDAQIRCVKCCTRTGARIVISIFVNEGYTLYHVANCPPHDKHGCFSILIAFL